MRLIATTLISTTIGLAAVSATPYFYRVAQTSGPPSTITSTTSAGELTLTNIAPIEFRMECTYDLATNLWGTTTTGSISAGAKTVEVAVPGQHRDKGNRILGLDLSPAETNDNPSGYWNTFQQGRRSGMDTVSLAIFWDDMEPTPTNYFDANGALAAMNAFFPAVTSSVALSISIIDTVTNRVPTDLAGLPFSDTNVIARFTNYLAWVMQNLPDVELSALAIGNEIDGWLGSDTNAWLDFATFHYHAAAAAKQLRPTVPVGTTVMLHSALDPLLYNYIHAINEWCDASFFTYYPIKEDFTIQPLESIKWNWIEMTRLYGDKPIYLMETGLQSSPTCNSSEAIQADFITETFRCWDVHADVVPLVLFNWMTDWSHEAAWNSATNYYAPTEQTNFVEYIRTLGYRTYPGTGTDKPAFTNLVNEAASRGWPAGL